jgi:thermosome
MANGQGQPIIVLPESAFRTTGRNAQRNNIMAAKAVADIVRTTLGPRGMDKMLVDDIGDIIITNDGATIVDEMNVEHPAAKMIVEVAKTQDKEVGDGTTTAVVLAGELLSSAEKLLDKGVHSTIIARGYKMAADKSQEILNSIGHKVTLDDESLLKQVAETAMTGKGAESAKEALSDISVRAVKKVVVEEKGKYSIDRDDIQIEKKQGGSIRDSELIEGVILDKERASDGMPAKVENPKILLLDIALEIKKTETDAKIRITSADQLVSFTQQEEKMLKEKADAIINAGATAVFCQKGMDDLVIHYLAKGKVFAVKNVSESNMKRLAKATGGRVVSNLKELSKDDFGSAKIVEEKKLSGDEMIFVSGCKNPKSVAILIRGGTEHVVDEAERAVTDAVGGVAAALEVGGFGESPM